MNNFFDLDFSEDAINQAKLDFRMPREGGRNRGPFFNGSVNWVYDANDKKLFIAAVKQGYYDACRTFRGIKKKGYKERAFENLAAKIQVYLAGESSFAHQVWCESFISDISGDYPEARYGQAQKVINMAFKYLYCCDKPTEVHERFQPCHMPLDQFTLAWYFTESGILYEKWSWFNREIYSNVAQDISEIIPHDVLGHELVIWKYLSAPNDPKIINLHDCCKAR